MTNKIPDNQLANEIDLYSIEERERQIALLKDKKRKDWPVTLRQSPLTLAKRANIKKLICLADLKQLEKQNFSNPVISLYLTFSGEKTIRQRKVFLSWFNSLKESELNERKEYIQSLTHEQRKALMADLAEISAFLEQFDPEDLKSVVVFKSGEELNEVVELPVNVPDSLTIDVDPYILLLVRILQENKKLLMVDISKTRAVISTYHLGYVEKIVEIKNDEPTNKVDKGIPGKAQRKRLSELEHFFKQTAFVARDSFDGHECDKLAIIGSDEALVEQFGNFLHRKLANNIIGKIVLSSQHKIQEVIEKIEQLQANERAAEEEETLATLVQYQSRGMLYWGLGEVLELQNRFLVHSLYVDGNLSAEGFVCRKHHFLSLKQKTCPYCHKELKSVKNIVDELVTILLMHNLEVVVVNYRSDLLRPYAGIAAKTYISIT